MLWSCPMHLFQLHKHIIWEAKQVKSKKSGFFFSLSIKKRGMHLRALTRSAFSLLEQWACPCNPCLNLFWLPVHLTNYLKSKSLLRPYFILLNLCCPTVSTLIGIFLPLAPSLQEGCQPRACCALVLPHQISYLFLCSLHSLILQQDQG